MSQSLPYILILYYSRTGTVKKLAEHIAMGVESVPNIEARLRTVPSLNSEKSENAELQDPFFDLEDLEYCSGLALGSPTRFGNMAAPLKNVIDSTSKIWISGGLIGKPATVFTSTASLHGGQESTLLSMMLPLLHHGMIILGLPFSHPELSETKTGGTPYGVSAVARSNEINLSKEEINLAFSMGKRLALTALKLL